MIEPQSQRRKAGQSPTAADEAGALTDHLRQRPAERARASCGLTPAGGRHRSCRPGVVGVYLLLIGVGKL